MAGKPSRFVKELTDEESDVLRYLQAYGETPRIRQRAHAVLLSANGNSIESIARVFDVDRLTVTRWLNRWENDGLGGLADASRSGAPPKLNESEVQKAIDLATEHPHSPRQVREALAEVTGKKISESILRRILRRAGFRWKRMRKSLKSKRDEKDFRKAQDELQELAEMHALGELDLYYCDESGFSLTPTVPYGWQRIGETIELPSSRSSRINTLGFLSRDGKFHPYTVEGNIDTDIVVACIDDFCDQLSAPTMVVIDNASVHTSRKFESRIGDWEDRGLFFYFLPPYCPELNLIETLWRMIKHHWLPLDAYESMTRLTQRLIEVFSRIGSWLRITLAPT